MNKGSEKIGVLPPEKNQEQTLAQENSEAEFQGNLEKATGEIESSKTVIMASADKRIEGMPVSSGLSKQKATEIYEQGGFAEKVSAIKKQIIELGTQTKAEVGSLTPRPRELRDFTKHYSGFWRDQLAKKILDVRGEFNQKNILVKEENLKRSETKTTLETEISILEQEIGKVLNDMESHRVNLEKEKSRIAYRIARLLGKEKKVPIEGALQEAETELERLRRELDEKKNLLGECEEIVLDETELKKAKEEIRKFYEDQKGIHDIFEQDKIKERDIANISQDKKVLFLHTLPIEGLMGNTSENNSILDTENITSIDKMRIVLGIEPTLSVSTINLSGEDVEKGFKTMYPIGLIIGKGTVLSAYGGDAGTYADSPFVRRSKYDRTLKSSVQEDISGNLQKAIKRESGSGTTHSAVELYNEVVVENPKVSGIFLDMKSFSAKKYLGMEAMKQAFRMSKELGLPVYDISPNGEMVDLTSDDLRTVTQEEILSYQCDLSTEEKVEGVKKVLKTQEKPNPEIQRKLVEISTQERSDKALSEAQEKRAVYSKKAEERLRVLKFEPTAKSILEGWKSFEEIYKNLDENASLQEELTLMFGGKTPEEIKANAESILQKATTLKGLVGSRENK
ncbi:MAG: hypothetical protein EXS46_00390 [Candidatus Taylorbacteria bacterium]|nr:hypothetical protein [Candidatus Taylorbacteria bacterium]